jgi:hypothetical protein
MSDQRTKARLAVSEFQSALRTKFEAERDFTRAHDQLGKLLDDLIAESEGLQQTELDRYFLIPVRHAVSPAKVKIKSRSKRGQRKRRWKL